ncbi:hypothetical protein F4810DRAFT_684333 [Camillea tinctor]|nr:hypothetical protein F4810DRAFT_684333 [Camillea tinctor]
MYVPIFFYHFPLSSFTLFGFRGFSLLHPFSFLFFFLFFLGCFVWYCRLHIVLQIFNGDVISCGELSWKIQGVGFAACYSAFMSLALVRRRAVITIRFGWMTRNDNDLQSSFGPGSWSIASQGLSAVCRGLAFHNNLLVVSLCTPSFPVCQSLNVHTYLPRYLSIIRVL